MGYLAACLSGETLAHDTDGAVGNGERLGGEDPENFSYIRCWSRIMLINNAAPQELARIMGVAMVRTSSRDLSKGVATSSMITICNISAPNVVKNAILGSNSAFMRPERISRQCTSPPSSPSQVVEMAQARSVNPPRV